MSAPRRRHLTADPSGKDHQASLPNASTNDTGAVLLSSKEMLYSAAAPGAPVVAPKDQRGGCPEGCAALCRSIAPRRCSGLIWCHC
jgi:hypothetical protein